ncbi:hypothetical protein V8B55DRAFT_1479505 [Mucor lusitanicus]|uniref:Retrotransposon gag domain-containing protein n=1 Tax=Mucor circinelloides f. lusitanicus TaxID=29924 RepID=A0A8H4BJA7_MUCCL|nr:hypothetical protein FB192DRAFT_1342800 [Mucor lusitanicus]
MPSLASNPSNAAMNESPVVVQQAAKRPDVVQQATKRPVVVQQATKSPGIVGQAAKIATSSPFDPSSHEENSDRRGWGSSVGNSEARSLASGIVPSNKQADAVVFGRVSLRTAADHDEGPVVKIESSNEQQASSALDGSYSLSGDNTSSSNSSASSSSVTVNGAAVHDGDCSTKPIMLSEATTTTTPKKTSNNKKLVSIAEYRASRRERFSSEKVYTTSIPPYDGPSTSPRQQAAAAAATTTTTAATITAATTTAATTRIPTTTATTATATTRIPATTAAATTPIPTTTATATVATPTPTTPTTTTTVSTSVKRAAETSVDELRQEQNAPLQTTDDKNVVAMETMLSNLKGKLVTLAMGLSTSSQHNAQKLSDAFSATTTKINYLKRTIATLKKDTTPAAVTSSRFDEDYKKLNLMMRLVPYFQWEGNVTRAGDKVFNTIYACLRQVDRAARDIEFDMERRWNLLIPPMLSSSMLCWLDGLLIKKPQLTWSEFKNSLLLEYEMYKPKAIKELTLVHFNDQAESMDSFVKRFIRYLEYAKVSDDVGAAYFESALPTLDQRTQFFRFYQHFKEDQRLQGTHAIYRVIDLFRQLHNLGCDHKEANNNSPSPAPRPQSYKLHHQHGVLPPSPPQQRSVSPKVEDIQLPQQHQQAKAKKQKFNHHHHHHQKKPHLHCMFHPKANSHLTQNCRNNPLNSSQ